MTNELNNFITKFVSNRDIAYEGNQEDDFKKLVSYFNSGINTFDRPDGFCKYNNNVLIIEHFEFDSSYKNKKGSTNRQELFRTSNIKPNKEEKIQIYRDKIKCNYTIENYIHNAIFNLNAHYSKIKSYKTNLINEKIITNNCDVNILFCIEDTTILGNIDSIKGKPLFLPYCAEFIKVVENLNEIDYFLFGSSFGSQDFSWFSSNSQISNYKTKQFCQNDTQIANLTPQTMMSFVQISDT